MIRDFSIEVIENGYIVRDMAYNQAYFFISLEEVLEQIKEWEVKYNK